MIKAVALTILILLSTPTWAWFDDDQPQYVRVATPYIELHTGPGRGHPIFYVAENQEWITILKRRTDWFKIELENGKQGWVPLETIETTLSASGQPVVIEDANFGSYSKRQWEIGALFGDFEGARLINANLAYHFTPNFALELNASQATGNFSTSKIIGASLLHQTFPEWKISPYFKLGTGQITTDPNAAIVQTRNRENEYTLVGAGVRYYVARRFLLRFEYNNYWVYTERDENEEVDEWKLGFSVFF